MDFIDVIKCRCRLRGHPLYHQNIMKIKVADRNHTLVNILLSTVFC